MNQLSGSANGSKPMRKKNSSFNKRLVRIAQVALVVFFMGIFAAGGAAAGVVASVVKDQEIPTYEQMKEKIYTNYLTSFAYFRDGTPIGKLPTVEDRRLVTKNEISPYIITALISTEDKNFNDHHGVSLKAIFRAALQQITGSEVQTGGSTITQQLVKNTLLEEMYHEELSGELKGKELKKAKFRRKLAEIFLALRLERYFSKDQILEAYLNEVYFGKGPTGTNLYGIEAAAKGFFGKRAEELNLAQSAYLVGVIQNPGKYSPFNETGLANGLERMKHVLDEMKEDGVISQSEYDQALKFDIKGSLAKAEDTADSDAYQKYPFLVQEALEKAAEALVKDELKKQGATIEDLTQDEYQERLEKKRKEILSRGYKVYTTIDKTLYDAFQEYASDPKHFWGNKTYTVTLPNGEKKRIENALQQLGAVLLDNKTGAILATVAGRDFKVEQTDHTTSPRQPGSASKPILAYGPGLEEKVILSPEGPIDDTPVVLKGKGQPEHVPMNHDGKFHGLMSIREALRQSWNIPAIKVYLDVTIPKAFEYAKKMGITTLVENDLYAQTGVIGGLTYGMTVEELTNAYATFANGGTFVDAYMIEKIENNEGDVIYKHQPESRPVFSEQTSYMITDMLRTVYSQGTGSRVKRELGKYGKADIAGKTGTTNDLRDLWFVGYTPRLTLGVWTGFDYAYSQDGDPNRAKIVWAGLMKKVFELKPEMSPLDEKFTKPGGLVTVQVCSKSGKLPTELCREEGDVINAMFRQEDVPTETCDVHVKARAVVVDGKTYLAQDQTPDDLVISKAFIKREPLQLPSNPKKPLSAYLPLDWEDTLPTETDPRVDDGNAPSTPTGFSVTYDPGSGKNILKWNRNPEADIAGYRIYRTNGFAFERIASIMSHQPTEFADASGGPGAAYMITAVDIAGKESQHSESMSAYGSNVPPAAVPSAPTGAKAKKVDGGVEITWNENPEAEQVKQYNIYFSLTRDGEYQLIGSNTVPYFLHMTFTEETGWYRITAVNLVGESEPTRPFTVKGSSGDSGGQGGPPPGQPGAPPEPGNTTGGGNHGGQRSNGNNEDLNLIFPGLGNQ